MWLGYGVSVAPIQPLAWEPPYAMGVALKKATHTKSNEIIVSFTPTQPVLIEHLLCQALEVNGDVGSLLSESSESDGAGGSSRRGAVVNESD